MSEKRTRYFIRNPESGEPWAYCGTAVPYTPEAVSAREQLVKAFGYFVEAEISGDFGGAHPADTFTMEIKRCEMTDEEVEALPDI